MTKLCLDVQGISPGSQQNLLFRDAVISYAIDISGSTYGATLKAEKHFIRSISNLLSPVTRSQAKVLPWDHSAHPIVSLAQLDQLEDRGGTDPGAILASRTHTAALKESSLWFIMTDGLIPQEARVRFANNVALHGVHGISCVIVIFGNPSTGQASCDISVGIGVFAAVPNCAFLFCNTTNGDLRLMQTKGTFNVLLKARPPPLFDSSSQWDSLPQISVTDFADVIIPKPQNLSPNEIALQDSLVINMDDLFANRLSAGQIGRIFDNPDSLESVRMTMQARNRPEQFRQWVEQQTIDPEDPLFKPRPDPSRRAESLFAELISLVDRAQPLPRFLQMRLRAAYRNNMEGFIASFKRSIKQSKERAHAIKMSSMSSFTLIDSSESLNPSFSRSPYTSVTMPTPFDQSFRTPLDDLGAPLEALEVPAWIRPIKTTVPSCLFIDEEEACGSWEQNITDSSLTGLLYTAGVRAKEGSFKGICPLCGTSGITLAWLFRNPNRAGQTVPGTQSPTATTGLPPPGGRTRLTFPLAMGGFPETAGVLAPPQPSPSNPSHPDPLFPDIELTIPIPILACDPCSVFYARTENPSHRVVAALPMVRFSENTAFISSVLSSAFENRFSEADLPQVFLSVLMLADVKVETPTTSLSFFSHDQPQTLPVTDFDLDTTVEAARVNKMIQEAVEWTARDLLHSVVSVRELSETFSGSSLSQPAAAARPLSAVLAELFEELDSTSGDVDIGHPGRMVVRPPFPLLRYPLQGFVVIVRLAALIGVGVEARRRATLHRLLYLVCEELQKKVEANASLRNAQAAADLVGGLIGKQRQVFGLRRSSVPIQELRDAENSKVLSWQSCEVLLQAGEFIELEGLPWAGPALALFLYGLLWASATNPAVLGSATESYCAALNVGVVGKHLERPDEVNGELVRLAFASLTPPASL